MRLKIASIFSVIVIATAAMGRTSMGAGAAGPQVKFSRDIRPIFAGHCLQCHGPDEKVRKAKLRLDLKDGIYAKGENGARVTPGDLKNSELYRRITTVDVEERMPPAKHGKPLNEKQIDLLKRWIEQGAKWEEHWAFAAPVRPVPPALPKVNGEQSGRNAIDAFLLTRLEKEGLKFSPEADRNTLIRRLSLDLTGLPPTPAEVELFLKDPSSDAYERLVDRLLASPRYGERWAVMWLDLARYADSKGFAEDNARVIWKYRDWVIQSINANMPFDEFTIEQIAGDLLPKPTNEQLIATAFHRNTLTNDEGGTDDEEWRTAAVVDRVNTTFQVWMGLTMACAQCHDHKFDPISQEEYFKAFAIFNQTEDSDKRDETPNLSTFTAEQEGQIAKVNGEIAALEKELTARKIVEAEEAKRAAEEAKRAAATRPTTKPTTGPATKPVKAAVNNPRKETAGEGTGGTKVPPVPPLAEPARGVSSAIATPATKPATMPVRDSKAIDKDLAAAKKRLADIKPVLTPVMRELAKGKQRKTQMFFRGNFLDKGPEVSGGTPVFLPPMPKESAGQGGPDRMGLAKWLVDEQNPLTARVVANRYWEQLFGVGLVETSEDFGLRSPAPINPELLDWLATELIHPTLSAGNKWDTKALVRLMVTSAAYRQTSRVTPTLLDRDPDNRLLARGPRVRPAEVIRDQVLAVSGLLSDKLFGPSVRPPQPKMGLSAAFGGSTDWENSTGDDRYRRGLYTSWRRSRPYPSAVTFDAPERSVCAVRRTRTNTPLQSLVTLNDPVYVEAAQALGRRMVKEGGENTQSRITYGVRLCLARPPSEKELQRLISLYDEARTRFAKDPAGAKKMATEPIGPLPANADPADFAAWAVVGNVMLNLDEMFLKR